MPVDRLENQATARLTQLRYQRLTMPTRQKVYFDNLIDRRLTMPIPKHRNRPYFRLELPSRASSGQWKIIARQTLWSQPTVQLRVASHPQQHSPRRIMQLLGYTMGTVLVITLYMLVPLMIILSSIFPSNWEQLLAAFGMLGLCELIILIILIKTTPKKIGQIHRLEHLGTIPRLQAITGAIRAMPGNATIPPLPSGSSVECRFIEHVGSSHARL